MSGYWLTISHGLVNRMQISVGVQLFNFCGPIEIHIALIIWWRRSASFELEGLENTLPLFCCNLCHLFVEGLCRHSLACSFETRPKCP